MLVNAAVPLEALHASVTWEQSALAKEEITKAVEMIRAALTEAKGK